MPFWPPKAPVEINLQIFAAIRHWNRRLSLRIKGLLSLIVVVAYALLMTVVVTQEQMRLPVIVNDLDRVHRQDELLIEVTIQGALASMTVSEAVNSGQVTPTIRKLFTELATLDAKLTGIAKSGLSLAAHKEQLLLVARNLAHGPTPEALSELRAELHRLMTATDGYRNNLRRERQRLIATFQQVHDKVTLVTLFFLFMGVIVVGAVMTIFFSRLTWDIRRVGGRAMAIVKGFRGRSLDVTRGDEVGDLMRAVNQMQIELRDRERQLELGRQQQFHHEKMAAVGSLAAAVAHEINNPIMAISGLAQVLIEQHPESDPDNKEVLGMIVDQAKRIALITRQISEFSLPQSPNPSLFDLNALVRSTASFVRFDQRYRRIDLQLQLDSRISAVFAVADQITQVLINLLINAADAVEDNDTLPPVVVVITSQCELFIELVVKDNGHGMSPEVLNRAYDEFFTTKPKGRGTGLGLYLCRTLVESNKGKIHIESTVGEGTWVSIRFPLPASGE